MSASASTNTACIYMTDACKQPQVHVQLGAIQRSLLTCLGHPFGQGGDQVHNPQHAVGRSEVPGEGLHQLHGSAEAEAALEGKWQSAAAAQQAAVPLR